MQQLLDGFEPQQLRQKSPSERELLLEQERDLYRQQSEDFKELARIQASRPTSIEAKAVVDMSDATQNIIKGDNIRAVQGGGNQAVLGDSNQVTQTQGTQEHLSKDDVIEMLAQIKALIEAAELPAEVKAEAKANLKIAKKATEQEEKQTIAANLEGMAETLEEASKTVEAGKTLWGQVSPALIKIAGWLGAAAGSILSNL